MITVQLDKNQGEVNEKQVEFFELVMKVVSDHRQLQLKIKELAELKSNGTDKKAINKLQKLVNEVSEVVDNDYRYFWYGGSIRGGKTVISMAILIIGCKMYPGLKCHVIRGTFPKLKSNSIPSLERIIGNSQDVYWKRSSDDYFCQFANGSRIYFMSENYAQDKAGTKFLGLETNWILLEQVEEIQKSTYNLLLSRLGSWHGVSGVKPPAILLATFNPSYSWVQKDIADLGIKGKLKKPHYFLKALSTDNPFNTKEQWTAWKNLDEKTYTEMILGELDGKLEDIFMHAFDVEKNTGNCKELLVGYDIVISFDFNVDPMTCVIMQTDKESFIRFSHSFSIKDSDTYELCEYLKPIIKGREHEVIITGDASGKNRISGTRGHINHYVVIQESLGLRSAQFEIPSVNPDITDSRVFCNSIFQKFPSCIIHHELTDLIEDVQFTQIKRNGKGRVEIAKTGMNKYTNKDNSLHGHNLDNVRYALHTQLYKWFDQIKSLIDS